jgi:hypothetical protein
MPMTSSLGPLRYLFLVTWRRERQPDASHEPVWRGTFEGRATHAVDGEPWICRFTSLDEIPDLICQVISDKSHGTFV